MERPTIDMGKVTDEVLAELNALAEAAEYPSYPGLNKYSGLYQARIARGVHPDQQALDDAREALALSWAIDLGPCTNVELVGFRSEPLDVDRVTLWLLGRAKQAGARQALLDLSGFFRAETVPARHVICLWGPTPTSPVRIDVHTSLVPPAQLPASAQKDEVLARPHWDHIRPGSPFRPRTTAAIVRRLDLGVWFNRGTTMPQLNGSSRPAEVLLLPLFVRSHVAVTAEWTEIPLEVPLVGGLQQTMPACPDERCRVTPTPYEPDLSGLEAACRNWMALPGDVHRAVTTALTRLNEASALHALDTAFIALASALEQLLLEPDKDRNVGFKVASRLARYLERDPDRRQQVFATAHEFYSHLGPDMRGLRKTGHASETTQRLMSVLGDMHGHCRRLILQVIERGELPSRDDVG
ncbi:MAG: hypothetical protein U1E45_16695 [Geminicoccaceae bacterium]